MAEDSDLEVLQKNSDDFFLIINGFLVFFMQCGFAFLEAGSVRTKNTVNILIKNMLDALIGGVAYWAIGWGISYGPSNNGFIGEAEYFSYNMDDSKYPSWFFQFVFAATAATIVSGSIAERVQFLAYFVYSIVITGFVYPVVAHWTWDGPGWLAMMGYKDFAGSGVVHLTGAVCALVACACTGARIGKFDENGKPYDMPGHSVPLSGLGGFILLFGFLAFNGGSQLAISNPGDSATVSRAVVNTILGGCSAGLIVLVVNKFSGSGQWSYLMTLNGALTGMVSMCAGCNTYQPWGALLVGIFGGFAFLGTHYAMLKFKLDDPLDAVAVHGGGGLVGLFFAPIFAIEDGIVFAGDTSEPWRVLGVNILGIVAISAWCTTCSLIIFYPMKRLGCLRVDRATEFAGNDIIKHGESAYPADAWVELQYNRGESGENTPAVMSGTNSNRKVTVQDYNRPEKLMRASSQLMNGVKGITGAVNTPDSFVMDETRKKKVTISSGENSPDSKSDDGKTNDGFDKE